MRSEYEKGFDKGFADGYLYGLVKAKKECILKVLSKQAEVTEEVRKGIYTIDDLDKLEEIYNSLF